MLHSGGQRPRPLLIGYWTGERAEGRPSPGRFVDAMWDADEREMVADYLDRGFVTRACMGLSPCRLCERPNGALELSDGVYVWPEGFSHYVRDHDVRPPTSSLNTCPLRSTGLRRPPTTRAGGGRPRIRSERHRRATRQRENEDPAAVIVALSGCHRGLLQSTP